MKFKSRRRICAKYKNNTKRKRQKNPWKSEINDIVRGGCGGFLFGIPLLYTMEVWWIGSSATPEMMLMALLLTFIVVYLLMRTEGFRKPKRFSRRYQAITETVEAMGIGLVCSAFMLLLLQELSAGVSLKEALGKIIFESVPFSLGVALANQLLGENGNNPPDNRTSSQNDLVDNNPTFTDLSATLIGATVIGFNIAPTDEIATLAAAVSEPWLLAIIAISLLISYAIVFQAGFSAQEKRRQHQGIFQKPFSETMICYLVSLISAAIMLWFFQKLAWSDPWTIWLEHSIILGLPTTIGGAAGRLAI
ncbi:putative integral membrane protein TIGR02587 [Rivularia sp. PCC 7116]|uniref:TIGR02587 family membrane protein n=1 Tax=Rivularia sp. PCC 7116 TaxID=373994 RepID=UPI00029F37FE|nr:TIGR02587 family membrane protein [Rivularia sp. PCC 7116]AFY52667.1 putative integral membrane protein TIGR02587 [Rivularia sp. PCC 7116]